MYHWSTFFFNRYCRILAFCQFYLYIQFNSIMSLEVGISSNQVYKLFLNQTKLVYNGKFCKMMRINKQTIIHHLVFITSICVDLQDAIQLVFCRIISSLPFTFHCVAFFVDFYYVQDVLVKLPCLPTKIKFLYICFPMFSIPPNQIDSVLVARYSKSNLFNF